MKKLAIVAIVMLIVFIGVGIFAVINSFEENQVTVRAEPINIAKNVDEMSTGEIPKAKITAGWHDQYNNRYYIIYLGKIELAEIYCMKSFQYVEGFQDKIELEKETISHTTIENSYTNMVSKVTSAESLLSLENELGLKAGVTYGIFSAEIENTFTTTFQKTWGIEITETNTQTLTTVIEKINRLQEKTTINCAKACTPGKYYRYSLCADVNCFAKICVSAEGEATCNFYSELVNPDVTFEMLLESDTAKNFYSKNKFVLDAEELDIQAVDTNELKVVYKPMTKRYELMESWTLNGTLLGGDEQTNPHFDISTIYNEAERLGYDTVTIEYSVYNKGTANTTLFGWLNTRSGKSHALQEWTEEVSSSGRTIYKKVENIPLSDLGETKEIYFYLEYRNDVPGTKVTVSDIIMDITVTKSK